MLVVASDRISVFDVVLGDKIPDKGRVLTALSTFWFDATAAIVPNHLVSADPTDFPETAGSDVAGRAMLVRRRPCGSSASRAATCSGRRRDAIRRPARCRAHGFSGTDSGEPSIFESRENVHANHEGARSARPDAPGIDAAAVNVGAEVFEQLRDLTLRVYEFGARLRALTR